MGDVIVGICNRRTLDELIIPATAQFDIAATITDQAIVGLEAPLQSYDARVIAVIDDTLLQQNLRDRARRRSLDYHRLVSIPDIGILKMVAGTGPAEIKSRPASREIVVRR